MSAQSFEIRMPDDWHLHLRDGVALEAVLPYTIAQFGRAIVMPNLKPPITKASHAWLYFEEIRALAKQHESGRNFEPLMTLYLTDKTIPEDIVEGKKSGLVVAAKLYPANATTNSQSGVTNIKKLAPVFRAMTKVGMVLCVHGETLVSREHGDTTRGGKVGQLRREAVFIEETLSWLVKSFPKLKIVLEHITTQEAVDFVWNASSNVAATITAHHLLATLDDALDSHHYKCMPVLKEEAHRQALLKAATSGNPKFFGGTDSAPHAKSAKETACGCAGCFTALHAIELYTTAFEEVDALDRLGKFLSEFGAQFYGLPLNHRSIRVDRKTWTIPNELPFGNGEVVVPFWANKELHWKVHS